MEFVVSETAELDIALPVGVVECTGGKVVIEDLAEVGIGEDDGLGFDDAAPAEYGSSCCAEEEAEEGDGVGETGAGLGGG